MKGRFSLTNTTHTSICVSNGKETDICMMRIRFTLLALLSLMIWSCEDEQLTVVTCDEGVVATIRDLTGLDGCGYVFELQDGTKLEPQILAYCGTPPLPKEVTDNPLYNFEMQDGKIVRIGYEEVPDMYSICMVGKSVRITCIEELGKMPDCLKAIINETNPQEVWRYTYKGNFVFVVTPGCCDLYVSVYDHNCNFICAPSGGFSGNGDGKCPDFEEEATNGVLIWKTNI
jgi:hypothetical protein